MKKQSSLTPRRLLATFVLAVVLATSTAAFADVSLRLGTVFPGWDELGNSGADRQLSATMTDLASGYARQLGRFCSLPETFLRESSSSILTALVFYEGFLPHGSSERVLLDTFDQRVSIVTSRTGTENLVLLVKLDRLGVGMVVCSV